MYFMSCNTQGAWDHLISVLYLITFLITFNFICYPFLTFCQQIEILCLLLKNWKSWGIELPCLLFFFFIFSIFPSKGIPLRYQIFQFYLQNYVCATANDFCHKEIHNENIRESECSLCELTSLIWGQRGLSHYVRRWHQAKSGQSLLKCF